jgi:cytidine deaminase
MKKKPSTAGDHDQLLKAAREATKNAYAPYSRFRVGAALLTTKGDIVTGCNVENASYGLTICAERNAIFSAVAALGPKVSICAIAVINDKNLPCSPCGACRQVIYEFGPDAMVLFPTADGWEKTAITNLLPHGFRLR